MGITKDGIQPLGDPFIFFTKDRPFSLGSITLPMTVGFLVVNCLSSYNAILECPFLNQLGAIISTYHPMMRFPINHEVEEVKGDQTTTR